jgi:hypothetical protein
MAAATRDHVPGHPGFRAPLPNEATGHSTRAHTRCALTTRSAGAAGARALLTRARATNGSLISFAHLCIATALRSRRLRLCYLALFRVHLFVVILRPRARARA